MYVATASPGPRELRLTATRGGMCPVFPPLGSATGMHHHSLFLLNKFQIFEVHIVPLQNKLVVLTTEWLPWLQSSCGYESFTLVTG